ncbi:MAG: malate dehydrogenase [Gammaproteobacteria bacterium]|nr:malate dehydrogenase [Gammaproteobacteria bacterium]
MMNKVIVTITGAAGNIAYSLIFRILSGKIFPSDTKIQVNLLDITEALPILKGVKYEIEDCAFESLSSILITDKAEEAFIDADFILLMGAKPRTQGMQRADLLLDNAHIFKNQGITINKCVKKETKIIVIGNPANTNALIIQNFASNIPSENITSLMRLDQNRAKSVLSSKLNNDVESITKLIVWGNHSATQYPDLSYALVDNRRESIENLDDKWIENNFIPRVQNRGAEIIEYRGKSSAASAASAIYDHLNVLVNNSNDWQSMGIISDNSYNISNEIFFSFPLQLSNSKINIINNLEVSEKSSAYLKNTEKELLSERDIIKDILKGN